MEGAQAHGPDGAGTIPAAVGDFTDPHRGGGTGGQGGGAGSTVEDAVEFRAVPGGKGPGRGSFAGIQPVGLVLNLQGVEQAELGDAGHQQQGHRVGQGGLEAVLGQHHPIGKQVGETAHPDAAVRHQQADPGGVQIIQPAGDVLTAGQQPLGGAVLVGKEAVLHRQRGEGCGGLPGAGPGVGGGEAPRQRNGPLEPACKIGAGQHGQHVPAAGRKAHDGDVPGVAAEGGNVFLDPVQGFGGIQQGIVAGAVRAVLEGGEGVEAQQPQPVARRHKDAVCPGGQAGARQLLGGAGAVAAAVEVNHHRQPGGAVPGVDIQLQAVLGAGGHAVGVLESHGGWLGAVQGVCPGGGVLGRLPAQGPGRGGAVGHAVPHQASLLAGLAALDRAAGGGPEGAGQRLGGAARPGLLGRNAPGQAGRRQDPGFQKAAP